jgi:hypothetical protein
VKRSTGWLDVTGTVTQAQPALARNGIGHWWPSKYGADDALASTGHNVRPGDVVFFGQRPAAGLLGVHNDKYGLGHDRHRASPPHRRSCGGLAR